MAGIAIFLLRDTTGVSALAKALAETYGMRLLADERSADALEPVGCAVERVDGESARSLLRDAASGVRVLVANFARPEVAGRGFMSWKGAMAAFDREIVATIREGAWAADRVAVVGNADDYARLLAELELGDGKLGQAFRIGQATKALRAASEFDFGVAQYLEIHGSDAPDLAALSGYPKATRVAWPRAMAFEEGENSRQQAALYGSFFEHFEQIAGPKLDYGSVLSVSRATYFIGEFERPTAAVWRMGRLVRAASDRSLDAILGRDGFASPPIGSWVVVNATLGEEAWAGLRESGCGGVIVPDVNAGLAAELKASGGLRVLVARSGLGYEELQEVRSVVGGALLQDKDRSAINPMTWTVVSSAQPLVEDWEALYFGARAARHVDSCACVCVRGESIVLLEHGRSSSAEAWRGLARTDADLTGAALVFDDEIEAPAVLAEAKARGVRVVLHAGIGNEAATAELRAAANAVGLTLLAMGRTLRRL